jgi:hypothetical protein
MIGDTTMERLQETKPLKNADKHYDVILERIIELKKFDKVENLQPSKSYIRKVTNEIKKIAS